MSEAAAATRMEPLVGALRRYARAAVGDAERADGCVSVALERALDRRLPGQPTVALYRAVYEEVRRAAPVEPDAGAPAEPLARKLRELEPSARHALLLCRLEGLDAGTAAAVMATSPAAVRRRVEAAVAALRPGLHAAVLIVEDNDALAAQLAGVVARLGHHVTAVARTAEEAVRTARDRRPDVVLADLDLGGAGDGAGLAELEALRADDGPPTIFVSGAPERVARRGLRRPDSVLRKPCDPRVLASAFARALDTTADRTG